MVYGAARVCKGINLRGREAYATVPNMSTQYEGDTHVLKKKYRKINIIF